LADLARNAKRFRTRYNLSKLAQPAYEPAALAARLASLVGVGFHNQRFLLNADEKWRGLWLRALIPLRAQPLFILVDPTSKFIVLPFLFRRPGRVVESNSAHLDKLSTWSLTRVEYSSSFSEIRKLYEELVEYIDCEVMGPSPYGALWQKARGFSQ
jgi:hypothetical protein